MNQSQWFTNCPSSDWNMFPANGINPEAFYNRANLTGVVLGVISLAICAGIGLIELLDFSPSNTNLLGFIFEIIYLIFGIAILLITHELMHAISLPKSKGKIVIAYSLKLGMLQVGFTGKVRKHEYVIYLLAPFVLLTLLPIVVTLAGWPQAWFVFPIVFNSMVSGIDITLVYFALKQIPPHATVASFNEGLFWRT